MIRDGSYAEFSSLIHERVVSDRVPMNVTFEVTRRCPLTCAHCYNNLPMGDSESRHREMSFEEICRIFDEMSDAGVMWLLLTGGEFFARRDALDIYMHARRRGLIVTIFTNGTLITERIADFLAKYPPFAIEVTLYGFTRETYEELTGIEGSYEQCMRGVRLLIERKLPLKLKTVAVNINLHEVLPMRQWVEEELGTEFKYDGMINPRVDCSQAPLATRLSPEELVSLDLQFPEKVDGYRQLAALHTDSSQLHKGSLYSCGGGVNSFAVDPYGLMSICVLSEVDKYDLRGGTLAEGWNDFLAKIRARPTTRPTKCTECSIKAFCGMCPANGELENADAEAPVDFLCRVAHLRARTFDVPILPHEGCEYCNGGEREDEIAAALQKVRAGIDLSATPAVLSNPSASAGAPSGCGAGGCGSCSSAIR